MKNSVEYNQLYTTWGEQIKEDAVLLEYPRPNLKRTSYLNINGLWNYVITKTTTKPTSYDGKIVVPFSPESNLSGVKRQLQPNEILWYYRKFHLHKEFNEGRILLHFGAVDQYCKVYVNNKLIGSHLGGYLPFSFDVTKQILEGENEIRVMVQDVSDTSYHTIGKQKLNRGGMFYTAQSGIWQTVWLESVPEVYIKKVKFTPLYDNSKIIVYAETDQKREGNIRIYLEKELIYRGAMNTNEENTIHLNNFKSWTPESPVLYTVEIKVENDRIESYFAMRKCSVDKDASGVMRLFLNNKPYFHNGILDQGYWPDGLYTAPSDEALIYDVATLKKLGFNMLRKHGKIEPLRWYYHCDRIGMLVWQDMVNGGESYNMPLVCYLPNLVPPIINLLKDSRYGIFSRKSPKSREEYMTETKEMVELLYNYPSIVMWVPFNEGWGQFDSKKVLQMIEGMDPTRTVDHASGWFDQGIGSIKSIHCYFRKIRIKTGKRAVVLSEFGGYSHLIEHHSFGNKVYGYRKYKTRNGLTKGYQSLYEDQIFPAVKTGLAAAVYTQVSDVEDEVNGLFTYDRKIIKIKPTVIKAINQKLRNI